MADTTSIYTDPSNMDKANVQLCIWNGTKWVELSNGKTINTINANISSIADKVKEAQEGIAQATTDAQNAVDKANSAIAQSTANSQDITTVKADITKAQSDISTVSNDLDTTKTNLQTVSDEATKNGSDIKDIQTDTTSIKSTLANTQGDVTRLQQTATTMQSDIKDNADNISSVTQTASGLTADMKDAKGNISTLQTNVSGLNSTVSSLSTDNTTNKTNISSLQQTANGLTSTVAEVQDQVTSSGSPNLWLNSNLATGDLTNWNWPSQASFDSSTTYLGTPSVKVSVSGLSANSWVNTGTIRRIPVNTGDVIQFGAWLKCENTDANWYMEIQTYANLTSNRNGTYSNGVYVTGTKDWNYQSSSYTVKSGVNYISVNMYMVKNGTGWICRPSLVKASSMPPYAPSPEDNATVTALSSVKQEADSISLTVTANKTSSDSQFSTINQTISGVQSTVSNKADSSTVTQLATLVNSKVNSSDYNSEITQLASDINLRVKTGDLISQINQQAGGDTLIQVASGKGKLYLDASSVVFGGTAFITSAMISSISADDITTGTMTAGAINLGNGTFKVDTKGNLTSSNATITGGSLKVGSNFSVNTSGILTASGATINGNLNVNSSGNLTTIDSNGFHNYDGDGNDIYIKNGTFKSTMYDEAYNATTSIEVQEGKLVAAYNDENISIYVGRQTAPVILWSDGSQIESSSGSLAVNSDKDMQFSSSSGDINFNSPSGTNVTFQPNGGGGVVFGALANFTKNAIVGNDQSGDQIWVRGAGNFNGKVSCQSLTQTSLLSKKTNITKLNIQDVINAINSTEIYEYAFKRDLEQGVNKRYASYIIDDVNEVAQYNEPSEFLSDDKQGRDDGTQLAYLTLMVQEMYKEIQELKNK